MLKIAVLVSGGGTNLQALLDAQASGVLHSGTISLVLSSKKDAFALERARRSGVETAILPKLAGESPDAYGLRLLSVLKAHGITLVVLAGFMLILDACVIRAYEGRILNVHPSLIPAFCGEGYYGLRVHKAALERGVKITGATVHLVNEIADGGPILAQKAVPVLDGDTPEALQQRVMEQAEWLLLPQETEALAAKLAEAGTGTTAGTKERTMGGSASQTHRQGLCP
ncbi:MAG: phosphoribosylglycinamide formyltransferase [Clostridia bacterium]